MTKSKNKKMGKKEKNIRNHVHQMSESQIKNNSPSISVCMIVKDEERFLDKCLRSIKEAADEIIIIDTGSQDSSINIAKKYTDKVYSHPWKDSYSEARNHYFDYAKGDWILQIDADEELVKEDIPALIKAVANPNIDAIMLPIVSHLDRGQGESIHNLERLFRNNGVIHYEGRIHERLVGYKSLRIYPVRLIHHGYDLNDQALSEKKNQRRISLLKKDIEEFPDNPLPYHYLSCCYLYCSLFHETLEVSLKALELAEKKNDGNTVYLWTRYNAAMAYYKLKDFKNAEAIALSATAIDKRHLDSYYLLTAVYFEQSKWPEVIKYGNNYLHLSRQIKNKPEEFGAIVANSFNASWKILTLMGIAYYETGNLMDSDKSFQSAISNVSNPFNALKTIGMYFYNKALFSQAQEYLKRAFDVNKEDTTVKDLLEKISSRGQTSKCPMTAENEEQSLEKVSSPDNLDLQLSLYINECMPDKAMDIIQNYAEKLSVTGSILCKIAVLYIEKGQVESALKCYMTALESDPGLFEAWAGLGEITLNLNRLEEAQLFFEKALEINKNDTEIMLGLCDIKAIKGDMDSIIRYCDILLEKYDLPRKKPVNHLDELILTLLEIEASLKKNSYSDRIKKIISNLSHKQDHNTHPYRGNFPNKEPLLIAIIDIPQNITTGDYYYRTFSPGVALAKEKDVYVVGLSNIHPEKFDIINNADIVILNNICDPDLLPVIRKRKEKGLLTIFELSDDLNALQPWNAVYEFYQNKENSALIYRLANYCDKLQFSAYELQKLYGRLNAINKVFPNQILDLPPERASNNNDEFIIGWGGSHGHLEDIASISDQLIKWIMSKPKARLYMMCSKPIWDLFKELPEDKKRHFPTGSLTDYYKFLSEIHVGIAPLQNTGFNRCRSDVKFLEYAVSGVVPLLSNLEPFRFSVVHGKTGFLFKDEADLINTLDLLENNRQILKDVSASAKAYVIRQRLQSDHINERLELYRNCIQPKRSMKKGHPDPESLFDHWCNFQGAVKNDRLLILSNTEFEKTVYSGLTLMQNKSDKTSANEYFEKASLLEPQNYLPFLFSSQTSTAPIAQLSKAIELAPFSIKAHIQMGEEFARQGKIADAITYFTRAMEIFPKYEIPLLRAGNLLKSIGKHDQAEELFRCASDLQISSS
jgi:tetratricopeptide (TPR) repeat protein